MDNWELLKDKQSGTRLAPAAPREGYGDTSEPGHRATRHLCLAAETRRELLRFWDSRELNKDWVVLNTAEGEYDLGLAHSITFNLDVSEDRVRSSGRLEASSAEALLLVDDSVDTIVCVGGLINYYDAAKVITEFGRVIRRGGYLLLEFDSSRSAELVSSRKTFGKSAAVASTSVGAQGGTKWVYSPTYIKNLLCACDFGVVREAPIHVLPPWARLLTRNARVAGGLARLDPLAKAVPVLTRWASSHFLVCRKNI